MNRPFRFLAIGLVAFSGVTNLASRAATSRKPLPPAEPPRVTMTRAPYHGWPGCIFLRNGQAEVEIVPAVGRVMQFRFIGEEGPFWENRDLEGRAPSPQSTEWGNFGGDKTWPAPQSEWPRLTGRAWPPPPAFDSLPVQATNQAGVVTLVSPVDPFYGIRTRRRIELDAKRPVLTVTTTYEKVAGLASRVSIWTITQLNDPVGIFIPIPERSTLRGGVDRQSAETPPSLKVYDGLISLTRDARTSYKIGSDAATLLWVGARTVVRIDSKRLRKGEYPDHGCSAEVYTNGGRAAYVELEMLGPLHTLRIGEQSRETRTYTLLHRSDRDPEAEARKLLHR